MSAKKHAEVAPSLFDLAADVQEVNTVVDLPAAATFVVDAPQPVVVAFVPTPSSVAPVPDQSKTMQQAVQMQQAALVFLEDPLARRLAVAWEACGGDESKWLDAAGLSAHNQDALRQCRALKVNSICRSGGVTDQLALAYIRQIIAKPLQQQRKKEKP